MRKIELEGLYRFNIQTVYTQKSLYMHPQQELIPFKHKEWSVVELVLSKLMVTGIAGGIRCHTA